MQVEPLSIEGSWVITPKIHADQRGAFLEWFTEPAFIEAVGHPLRLAQANCSVSARGVVRGIHFADVPPGQAKYVTCVSGAVLDVVVDLRTGSPTFGRWEGVRLDDVARRAVYLAEGLGHGFCALTEGATVVYLCSEGYAPTREHGVHPLDPDLAIDWGIPAGDIQLSPKDADAPMLEVALAGGSLPGWVDCQAFRSRLGGSPR